MLRQRATYLHEIHSFFYHKQPVYKQLGLELQKVKQHLGLKHVTISNFTNKIFAYENIVTTLHNHISVYYTDIILFSDFIISVPSEENGKKKN